MSNIQKTISYLKRNGLKKTVYMVRQRLGERSVDRCYDEEFRRLAVTPAELKAQAQRKFDESLKISILVPAYEPAPEYLRMLIDRVLIQSFENYELIIADAGNTDATANVVAEFDDDRVVYVRLPENKGIAGNTNEALKAASGSVVALLDHDDFLEPDALYYIADSIEKGASVVYTDEDKVCEKNGELFYFKPNRKSPFNLDMLLSNNYICHFFAVKTEIARQIGGFRCEYDGAQDYDFILRCITQALAGQEYINEQIVAHVPRVLYHWRVHDNSTAENPESKLYAYEAGRSVLDTYVNARSLKAEAVHTEHRGFYRIIYDGAAVSEERRKHLELHMPEDIRPESDDYRERMLGYFQRPEIRAVVGRVIDRAGLIEEEPFRGMHYWDSGLMHCAAVVRDVQGINGEVYLEDRDAKEGLVVYDPGIVFHRS